MESSSSLIQQLDAISESLRFFLPELALVSGMILVLIFDLLTKTPSFWRIHITTLLSVSASLFASLLQTTPTDMALFNNLLKITNISAQTRPLLDVATLGCLLLYTFAGSRQTSDKKTWVSGIGEEHFLWLSLLLGAHCMAMANHWLSLYLSIELASLSAYALTAFRFQKESAEVSIKYLVFGGIASALMLYGISWIYGFHHILNFESSALLSNNLLLQIGLLMALSGVFFKLAIVPFQAWLPNVYQVAPTPVSAFFSIVPKIAGLAALFSVLQTFESVFITGTLTKIIASVGVFTLTWGNLSAFRQTNLLRLLGYSSIAHAGLFLLVITQISVEDSSIFFLFAKVYILMNVLVFCFVYWTQCEELPQLQGKGKHWTVAGVAVGIALLSLTGLPPTAGFTAKFLIFAELWKSYTQNDSLQWFIIFALGLLNTAASLFYYLKIPYFMFLKDEGTAQNAERNLTTVQKGIMVSVAFALLFFFFYPDWL